MNRALVVVAGPTTDQPVGIDRRTSDVVIAAEKVTPAAINFMAKEGRGLICVPMLGDRLDSLRINPMVERGEPREAAFPVSVDAKRGVTTGISAHDRARTVRALLDGTADRTAAPVASV